MNSTKTTTRRADLRSLSTPKKAPKKAAPKKAAPEPRPEPAPSRSESVAAWVNRKGHRFSVEVFTCGDEGSRVRLRGPGITLESRLMAASSAHAEAKRIGRMLG